MTCYLVKHRDNFTSAFTILKSFIYYDNLINIYIPIDQCMRPD